MPTRISEAEYREKIKGEPRRRRGPKTYYQRNPVCHGCGYKNLGVFRLLPGTWDTWECWDCWSDKIRARG